MHRRAASRERDGTPRHLCLRRVIGGAQAIKAVMHCASACAIRGVGEWLTKRLVNTQAAS
eukprot:351545-Chlamydomonas_euryale.AAC.1